MADIAVQKTKLVNKINKTGVIEKKNNKQPKAYKNEYDVICSYNDDDVVFTYKGVPYTQGDITAVFENVEYFIKPNAKPKVKEIRNSKGEVINTVPVLDLQGNEQIVVKAPNKANGSETNSRHLPVGWVILKVTGRGEVFCVNPEIFFTNPMVSIRNTKLFPNKYDYPMKYTKKDFSKLFRILVNTPEFTGSYGSRKNTWGNKNVSKFRKLTDDKIYELWSRIEELHKWEVLLKPYQNKKDKGILTEKDKELYNYYNELVTGENQCIMDDFNIGENRGFLTDFRVWMWLVTDGKSTPITENSKSEGVCVIPNLLSHVFVTKLTNKRLDQVWKEI